MGVFQTRRRAKWLNPNRRKWIPFKPALTFLYNLLIVHWPGSLRRGFYHGAGRRGSNYVRVLARRDQQREGSVSNGFIVAHVGRILLSALWGELSCLPGVGGPPKQT